MNTEKAERLRTIAKRMDGIESHSIADSNFLLSLADEMERPTVETATEEQKIKFFEENVSPFMRVAYNQALVDVQDWAVANYDAFTPESFVKKVRELSDSKKQVDWDKMKVVFEESKPLELSGDKCPTCGAPVTISWSGLELVENTGDETLAQKHYKFDPSRVRVDLERFGVALLEFMSKDGTESWGENGTPVMAWKHPKK